MFDPLTLTLALNLTMLTAVYWVCLIVGGGLLVISTVSGADTNADVGGDFEADFDAELDADMDLETEIDHVEALHGGAMTLSTWFSIRFLVFAMAVFGALGVVLTHMTELGTWFTLVVALVSGLVVGQCVHQLVRGLRRSSGDSTTQPQDYVNKLARVTIAIDPPKKGEVALRARRSRRYIPAIVRAPGRGFEVGDEVVVVAYRAGTAEVVSRAEFESHPQTNEGGAS